jgi:hypothetical protein
LGGGFYKELVVFLSRTRDNGRIDIAIPKLKKYNPPMNFRRVNFVSH